MRGKVHHSDTWCPFPRRLRHRDGIVWECTCGRVWRFWKRYGDWKISLISAKQDEW